MSKILEIYTGYTPRPLQAVLHRALKRFNVICCHRRFGKTIFSLNETVDQGLRCKLKSPQYAYIAPTYGQAKRVAWDALKDICNTIPNTVVNEAELRVDIPRPAQNDRVRIMLLGAENPGSVRGIYLDGVVLDEFAEMDPIIWSQVVRPALSDRLGWGIFIGTPKGQNGFYDLYNKAEGQPDWHRSLFKASETGVISISELEAARAIMSPEEYEQEYECSFSASLVGAYYAKRMAEITETGRICHVPFDPAVLVDTFWDLGIEDTTVIWFGQRVGKAIHFIDYVEKSGEALDFYVRELEDRKFLYGTHYLPHDAEARELGTGKSRTETLIGLGVQRNKIIIVPRSNVEDGINAVRMILPRCWFDAKKCKRGIEALKSYERRWDPKNKVYQQRPLHNWASHAADAFRTCAMGFDERRPSVDEIRNYPRQSEHAYNVLGGD